MNLKKNNLPDKEEFPHRIIEMAAKAGADQAEVYVNSSKALSIEIKNQAIDAVEDSISFGYSLRIIKNNRLGFSYSTDVCEMESVVRSAVETAKWTDEDLCLALPQENSAPTSELEIFDNAIKNIDREKAVEHVQRLEKSAIDYDPRIKKVRKASGVFKSGETVIVNSLGINSFYPYTKCAAHVMTVAEDGNEGQMGWDYDGSRFLSDVSFENVGKTAAKRALQLLGSKKIATTKSDVLLDSAVASEFAGVLSASFSADSVQKGRSLLKDKIGKRIISPKIDIIDSGIIPRKLGTTPVDGEGVKTFEKILVSKGALQSYLHNTYTAKKENTVSTGNAVRGGFTGIPSVGISNLYIKAVSKSDVIHFNDLLGSIDKGLYVTEAMGMHTANPISGEFSIGVSGLWIEKGKIQFPVKEALISGNILSLFENIEAVADDTKFYGNTGTPSILIKSVDISA
jgi:PmbA protein